MAAAHHRAMEPFSIWGRKQARRSLDARTQTLIHLALAIAAARRARRIRMHADEVGESVRRN